MLDGWGPEAGGEAAGPQLGSEVGGRGFPVITDEISEPISRGGKKKRYCRTEAFF